MDVMLPVLTSTADSYYEFSDDCRALVWLEEMSDPEAQIYV